jgi:hypothetical protein
MINTTETTTAPNTDPFVYNTSTKSHYTSTVFIGIMIDIRALRKSTTGYGQFQALQLTDPLVQLDTLTKGQVSVQFGIGITSSIRTIHINTPIGKISFHVVQADIPFLLCLADIDELQVYYNNLKNILVIYTKEVLIARRFSHPFLLWNTSLQSYLLESFDLNPYYFIDIKLL